MLGLFSRKKQERFAEYLSNDALIIDVRTPGEYSSGHVDGSQNIPLDKVSSKVKKIKETGRPVITCCASGMRSASAAQTLKSHGIDAINGGSWQKVNSRISKIS